MKTQNDTEILACFFGGLPQLIHCSFRYYIGRQTIATCTFAQCLAKAWPMIPDKTATMIRRELEEAFKDDDDARSRGLEWTPLGMDCDRAAWEQVRTAYHKLDKTTEKK